MDRRPQDFKPYPLPTELNIAKIEHYRNKIYSPPGGLEPPTFRLTAERASQLRHGGLWKKMSLIYHIVLSETEDYQYY